MSRVAKRASGMSWADMDSDSDCDVQSGGSASTPPWRHESGSQCSTSTTDTLPRTKDRKKRDRNIKKAGKSKKDASAKDAAKEAELAKEKADKEAEEQAKKEARILEWDLNVTTVMIRNVPKRMKQEELMVLISDSGFLGCYDFLYLPIDGKTGVNRGFAFVNFGCNAYAASFKATFDGMLLTQYDPVKEALAVLPASIQGFEENYSHHVSTRKGKEREDPGRQPFFQWPVESGQATDPCMMWPRAPCYDDDCIYTGEYGLEHSVPHSCDLQACYACGAELMQSFKFCAFCGCRLLMAEDDGSAALLPIEEISAAAAAAVAQIAVGDADDAKDDA
eukprot:TRINITY_DN80252_c0_g1_i1.p1 TRINITY_DN80252_c0_g1~~TRINITY_DN80252_c0_g1_i1.p1  ORF type:complete len:335 (+),score=87.15 TRINITY_DN80252_c0_g1_i1:86-1090(+)